MAANEMGEGAADAPTDGRQAVRDEAELVQRAKGDPEAFGLLYEAHSRRAAAHA